jgi:hypothetical protein
VLQHKSRFFVQELVDEAPVLVRTIPIAVAYQGRGGGVGPPPPPHAAGWGTGARVGIVGGEGGFQQIQLRTEDRENGDLGAVAP